MFSIPKENKHLKVCKEYSMTELVSGTNWSGTNHRHFEGFKLIAMKLHHSVKKCHLVRESC